MASYLDSFAGLRSLRHGPLRQGAVQFRGAAAEADALSHLASRLEGTVKALRARRSRRRAIRDLALLDDRLLADIGVEPGQLRAVVDGVAGAEAIRSGTAASQPPSSKRWAVQRPTTAPPSRSVALAA